MMAAAKKGSFVKKKRSDPTRNRRPGPDPEPSPPSPETRRSLRPRHRRYLADFEDEFDLDEEDDDSKGRRKLKLVLKLPPIPTGRCRESSPVTAPKSRRVEPDRHVSPPPDYSPATSRSATSASSRDEEDEEEEELIVKPLKKRRIERVRDLDGSGHREERRGKEGRRPIRAVSGTPMPERNQLELILNKLQKRDTYGVFARPVDPEELPDYHDVIEHPMDFGTVRKKLASGRYRSFEQFEDDVFLICSNAMQYNAPDTIYFRQACSIQDMARRYFQETRADLISNGAERKSKENIRSASSELNIIKKVHPGIAPRHSSFHVSSEKKTLMQPSRDAFERVRCDTSSMVKKAEKKHYRTTPELRASDIPSMEKRTMRKPQYRTPTEPPGYVISSMEKKMLTGTQYRTAPEPRGSAVSSMEKKTSNKHHHRTKTEAQGCDMSSVEKKQVKKPQYRAAHESPDSDHSSMKKKPGKKPQYKTEPEPERTGSDISSMEKATIQEYQSRTEPEPVCSDISSQDKKTQNEHQSRTEPEPVCSDISSKDKKTQNEHQSRIAHDTLCSDISSDATLASSAGTFADLSKIPTNGNASAAEPCTGFSTVEINGTALAGDTSIGMPTEKSSGIERSVAINGSTDGSSPPAEDKSEKPDDIPDFGFISAKSTPSKLGLKPFINRRVTYTLDEQPVVETDLVFDVFEGETKQLVSVGLDSEYSYARSLARFAASLGPVAWDIASKKIEQSLPPGVKFGPGWVGEYEPLFTPVLSIGTSMQQLPVTRKDKGNEVKLESISAVSRKNKGNEVTSQRRNGQCKDMSFGLMSQMPTGMPSNRASTPSMDGRERSQVQKHGLFGVNLELQPCTSRATLQKKNEPASNLARKTETAGHMFDICPEAPKSSSPSLVSQGWIEVQTEAQKQQQKTRVTQTRDLNQKQQQQKNRVVGDLTKANTNESTRHRPEIYAESRASNSPAVRYLGNSQMHHEPLKLPDAVTSQRRNDGVGTNCGALNNWKSCDTRQNTPFGIITYHQPGVQYWLARGSQEQAVNDPLRWMNTTGNLSNQPNTSNRGSNHLDRTMPTVKVPKQENPNAAAAAAQAWMSIGASAEWKPVNGGGHHNTQVGPPAFNPTWRTQSPASRVHEEANVKPKPMPQVAENTQVQSEGLVIFPQLMSNDLSRLRSPWQGLAQHNKQKDTLPPDLNISFQPPGSPARSSSGLLVDSQQPDLALQL